MMILLLAGTLIAQPRPDCKAIAEIARVMGNETAARVAKAAKKDHCVPIGTIVK